VATLKVEGKVLKVVNSINASDDDALICRRFNRLCGFLRSTEFVWRVLKSYKKDEIIREAQRRQSESNVATDRKEAS